MTLNYKLQLYKDGRWRRDGMYRCEVTLARKMYNFKNWTWHWQSIHPLWLLQLPF